MTAIQPPLPLTVPSPLAPSVGGNVQAQRTAQPDVRVCVRTGCTNPAIGPGDPYCEAHDWTREPVDGERSEP